MNRQKIYPLGVILLVIGCITSLYLAIAISYARAEGLFASIRTDSPLNRFDTFRCPLLLGKDETFTVLVEISDPVTTTYDLDLEAEGFNILSQDNEIRDKPYAIIWTWELKAVESGRQELVIEALSAEDRAQPGIFHMWPTSYLDSRGLMVVNLPLKGKLILFLSLTSVLGGALISCPGISRRIRERRTALTENRSDSNTSPRTD
jgi:hypothetical protein